MILAINIGNIDISVGCMEGTSVYHRFRLATDLCRTEDEYSVILQQLLCREGIDAQNLDGSVVSSVVPQLTDAIVHAVESLTKKRVLTVGAGLKTGLNIKVDNPAQLGADLVAAAVGALNSYPAPLVIVDFGTATTLTVIDKESRLVGCTIASGVALSLSALSHGASLLPHIPLEAPKNCIGTNTVDCMKAGAVYGAAATVDGLTERIEEQLGTPVHTVATGNFASVVVPLCRRTVEINSDLHMIGLALLFEKNKKLCQGK